MRGFEGDLSPGYADRTVAATDTSICQVWAGAVLYPRGTADLVRIARVTAGQRWHACGSMKCNSVANLLPDRQPSR